MQTDLDNDLLSYFTDVEHLRDTFKRLVAAPMLAKRLFVIWGVGGVGKSSLLRMFRLHCKGAHVPIALASGDEAKSALDVLARWTDDLKVDGVAFPAFGKAHEHYRAIQAKVDEQAKKAHDARSRAADIAGKVASKTAEAAGGALTGAAIGSVIPGIGTAIGGVLGGVMGGIGAEALVDWLRGFLTKPDIDLLLDPTKKLIDDFLADITPAADKRRIVLILDTFEQMAALDDWARDVAQRAPANVLLVIAGRALPNWSRAWSGWMANAQVEELKPMTEDVMRDLIRRYYATMRGGEPNPAQVDAIARFARGLPMVVTSAVQLWVKYGVEDFQSVKAEIVANLVDRLMEGVPKELIPALEAAAVVRWFDQPILRAVTGLADVRDVYNELRQFPFVRGQEGRFALHDAVREIMDENLHVQDSERHSELHERAAAYFEKRLEKATGEESERLELERLYHRVRANEEMGIKLFQEMAEELTRYRLVNRLRALLNDVNTYPLERENSRLWSEYYKGRLTHFDGHFGDAMKLYEKVGKNDRVAPKLQAYALRDWGNILMRTCYVTQPEAKERAARILEKALSIEHQVGTDIIHTMLSLCGVYHQLREYDKAMQCAEKAYDTSLQQNDTYAKVLSLENLRTVNGLSGNWKEMFRFQGMAEAEFSAVHRSPYLVAKLMGGFISGWIWTGRYAEAERMSMQAIEARQEIGDPDITRIIKEAGFAKGFQEKYQEAERFFLWSLDVGRGSDDPRDKITLSAWGRVLTKQGALGKARQLLYDSVGSPQISESTRETDVRYWIAELNEVEKLWDEAKKYYDKAIDSRWTDLHYSTGAARTGLVRVKHAQDDYAAIPPLLVEAEQLAQQYEYNDHLASLRLTQSHLAWEGRGEVASPTAHGRETLPLRYYQHALIYALRYNRFLLDEVLGGRPQGTPLRPIIPYCLERGEEGRQMLIALRDWWQTGVNDIGTPRPDTISPIPEGIALMEAERIAREREPGDGSPQKSVVEQLGATLSKTDAC